MLSRIAVIGSVALLLAMILAGLFAPLLAPVLPNEMIYRAYAAPGAGGLLGADGLGRDMLSRVLYGMRYTLFIAFAATTLAGAIGVSLAIASGLLRGWVDILVGRGFDILMSIPHIILALIVLAILGVSMTTLILTMAVLQSSTYFRVTRPIAADLVAMEYVEVARLRGERLGWNLFREIFPNMVPSLMAQYGLGLSSATLFISSLSFLGIGIQPPAADLGGLVRENALALSAGQFTPLIPAACIALFCLAVNGIADWLVSHFAERPEA